METYQVGVASSGIGFISDLIKICSAVLKSKHSDGQTDRLTDMRGLMHDLVMHSAQRTLTCGGCLLLNLL
jgi:hypothetical protein